MIRRFRSLFWGTKQGARAEDPPPPYGAVWPAAGEGDSVSSDDSDDQVDSLRNSFAGLDLLAACKNCDQTESQDESLVEHYERQEVTQVTYTEMGQKASLLNGRHRSKVSLTWVLRERSDIQYNPCNSRSLSENCSRGSSVDKLQRYQRTDQKFDRNVTRDDNEHYGRGKQLPLDGDRVIGRGKQCKGGDSDSIRKTNRQKNISSYRSAQDSWADLCGDFGSGFSTKKHRHRRRKSRNVDKNQQYFGYEIKDIDCFLAEASIDNPGNIPVVVTYPSVLYQTRSGSRQRELALSLGMVVNAVFKNQQWLYVQTPHGEEGYVLYASCLPLGILPPLQRSQPAWKDAPCWESTLDLYPQPCGNMTDSEKEQLRGGTKSECGRSRPKHKFYSDTMSAYGEKTFDKLYLKATSSCPKLKDICDDSSLQGSYSMGSKPHDFKRKFSIRRKKQKHKENNNINNRISYVTRHTLLVVEMDYEGSKAVNTLSVKKGDVVILVQGDGVEADVDSEWFYVRNKDGVEGFIPAAIAGHGFL